MSCWVPPSEAVTGLAALLGAAIGAFLSHRFSRNRDHLELKRDVLHRVMGYRWTLTEDRQDPEGRFFTALNEALVVFAGETNVERGRRDFSSDLSLLESTSRQGLEP